MTAKRTTAVMCLMLGMIECSRDAQETSSDELAARAVVESTYTLRIGGGQGISELKVMLWFDSLLSDNRCPANIECVWEGNAEVLLALVSDVIGQRFTLNTSSRSGPTSFVFHDYCFSIDRLLPYPHLDSSYSVDDYILSVRIEKL